MRALCFAFACSSTRLALSLRLSMCPRILLPFVLLCRAVVGGRVQAPDGDNLEA